MGKPEFKGKAKHTATKWQEAGKPRCFYTGMPLQSPTGGNPWGATIEHLLPRFCAKIDIEHNEVFAAHCVNTIIGHAPLRVKFHIKEELKALSITKKESKIGEIEVFNHNIFVFPGTTPDFYADFIKSHVKTVIEQYKAPGIKCLPWEFFNATAKDKKILHKIYWDLLTDEEKELVRRFSPINIYDEA